ncbi:hypothetical protein Tco_0262825, partial [Tanacetum coccineum]
SLRINDLLTLSRKERLTI